MPSIDPARLTSLLAQYHQLNNAGASARSHKDYYDLEAVLDEMQTMLGLGMVQTKDIISKAEKALSR